MQVRETLYKGIQFRSRLEARWAVFFDALGLKWEYEPEGYRMDDGTCYLPDFYVHDIKGHVGKAPHGDGIFVEVKGELGEADKNKLNRFQYPIYVVGNLPKSQNPWTDVTIEFEKQPRYMFSEYTVDGTEEDLWFGKKGNQVYLLRYSEFKRNAEIDVCKNARDAAINKKFEYQNNKGTFGDGIGGTGNTRANRSCRTNGGGVFDSFFRSMGLSPDGEISRPGWMERSKERIPLNTFKSMFLGMPGIREHRLEDRIQFNMTEDIPVASSLVSSLDRDRVCFSVEYHYLEDNGSVFNQYFEKREILYVPFSGREEQFVIESAIKTAIKCMKKEMSCYPADAQTRKRLDEEENKEREKVRLDINRARLAKEDEDMYIAMNNPYSIGELMEAMRAELNNEENSFKYADYLRTFALKDDRNEDEKFGVGEFFIDRAEDIVIMQMRRTYRGHSASGRYYDKFDGRKLFTIDATTLSPGDNMQHSRERNNLMGEFKRLITLAMERLEKKEV